MGYDTKFQGTLKIEPALPLHLERKLSAFSRERHDNSFPSIYCQWVPSGSGLLKWDGKEKFYEYEKWIEFLIDNFLKPNGHVLNGHIFYRGDKFEDAGVIEVENNHVTVRNWIEDYDLIEEVVKDVTNK